jgi:hypothetical protein
MAESVRLYDAYDRPVNLAALRREHAAPQVAGVRTVWQDTVASGLTPKRLAALIRRADDADHYDYLTLAEEIEERDGHYRSVLGTRKLAVAGLEPVVIRLDIYHGVVGDPVGLPPGVELHVHDLDPNCGDTEPCAEHPGENCTVHKSQGGKG